VTDTRTDLPWIASKVLHHSRPDVFRNNQTLSDMDKPQTVLGPPSFIEFLTWMKESRSNNQHWSVLLEDCHPCAHKWDAILRTETMVHDGNSLLSHLKPEIQDDVIAVKHSHSGPAPSHDWLRLSEYDDVSDEMMTFLLERYRLDMEMFGYHWESDTSTASCAINTPNGPCC
jgi:hypothetical protein